MKHIFPIIFLLSFWYEVCAQKPPLDTGAFDKWPSVSGAAISNDGNYAYYTTQLGTDMSGRSPDKLVVKALHSQWKLEIAHATEPYFSDNSRLLIFKKMPDSLGIIGLGSTSIQYVPHVESFRLFKGNGDDERLAYTDGTKHLVMLNLSSFKKSIYDSVDDFSLSQGGNALVLQIRQEDKGRPSGMLQWVDLVSGNIANIWRGSNSGDYVFDSSGKQFVFSSSKDTGSGKTIWYYRKGIAKAELIADDGTAGVDSGLQLGDLLFFSNDGEKLFFNLREKEKGIPNSRIARLDVWNYKDIKLQSEQLKEPSYNSFLAEMLIRERRIIRLQKENEEIEISPDLANKFLIVNRLIGVEGNGEEGWNKDFRIDQYVGYTKDGTRRLLRETRSPEETGYVSPEGNFLVYYDSEQRNFFSYEMATGIKRNISRAIHVDWLDFQYDVPDTLYAVNALEGWAGDTFVILHDQYDLWLVDMVGIIPPVNITNWYGRLHNIRFHLPNPNHLFKKVFKVNQEVILSAFNRATKEMGYFRTILDQKADPQKLVMGPYFFEEFSENYYLKARDAAVYLLRRESASESPNYLITTDFKSFIKLSDLYPERNYNWLTTDLIRWKSFDGVELLGVLYKPENFDSTKKYPVIFNFYEKKSDQLHQFFLPGFSTAAINIPWFVSNGYLVFLPDIRYKIGRPGYSAYNSIVSAADYLSKFAWVDSTKMGIQGHSHGGYESNYIVTHTNKFAAAVSAAGISDLVSDYGYIWGDGSSKKWCAESGLFRIGTTLWQRPDLYIENSPVFYADKVSTPVLLINNKEDVNVAFTQGVEFFTALARLGKKAWMLQYDGEDHLVDKDKRAESDYTIRMTQFFDHYLKGAPPPFWMTIGIPAKLKGVSDGLQLDLSGRKP